MSDGHYNVLFLSNRNTARSIFAEAVMNRMGRGNSSGFSAGIRPADQLDPMVRDVLQVAQYPTDTLHPKHWTEFAGADAPPLDFVFTLCDPTVGEPLPHWPGRPVTADWRYPDPLGCYFPVGENRRYFRRLGASVSGPQFLAFWPIGGRFRAPVSGRDFSISVSQVAETGSIADRDGFATSLSACLA
jgi:arsenate reductase (thioredoxin)